MRVICVAKRDPNAAPESFAELADAESQTAMRFAVDDFVREIYSIADGSGAVIIVEAESADAAKAKLSELPFVKAGLLSIDYIPIKAYRALAKLAG